MSKSKPRFLAASDHTMLVRFGREISGGANDSALRLMRRADLAPLEGVRDVAPAYASVLVRFDPRRLTHASVEEYLKGLLCSNDAGGIEAPRIVEIPVMYGGPDLASTATLCRVSAEQFMALHASVLYRVYFLGFSPGFAYLGEVPPEIAVPRLDVPRKEVPAGSVGIAGRQTGVYPSASPGGWRIIGRTPLRMFDAARDPMSLVAPGDRVRFVPVESLELAS